MWAHYTHFQQYPKYRTNRVIPSIGCSCLHNLYLSTLKLGLSWNSPFLTEQNLTLIPLMGNVNEFPLILLAQNTICVYMVCTILTTRLPPSHTSQSFCFLFLLSKYNFSLYGEFWFHSVYYYLRIQLQDLIYRLDKYNITITSILNYKAYCVFSY